jgi:hypothetical protein
VSRRGEGEEGWLEGREKEGMAGAARIEQGQVEEGGEGEGEGGVKGEGEGRRGRRRRGRRGERRGGLP